MSVSPFLPNDKASRGSLLYQEAKLCSDGSYVGRTGPKNLPCPGESGGSGSVINSLVALLQ